MEKTRSIKATIGWFDDKTLRDLLEPEKNYVDINRFNRYLQKFQREAYEKYGIYVAFQTSQVDCVYHRDWGCPNFGEPCILMTAIANPKFIKNLAEWELVALEIIRCMKDWLDQSTVTVEIYDSNIIYLE